MKLLNIIGKIFYFLLYILVMSICYILAAIIVLSIKVLDVIIDIIKRLGIKNEDKKRCMD